jgi:hypothetical protein
MSEPASFIARVQDVTGFSDGELGVILGIPANTVRAYRVGVRTEYINGRQRQALLRAAHLLRDRLIQGCAELERLA